MQVNVVNKYRHTPTKFDHYCGRGSPLGNPFPMSNESQRLAVCKQYYHHFFENINTNKAMSDQFLKIEQCLISNGQVNLVCFCAPKMCHCDTIKKVLIYRYNKG